MLDWLIDAISVAFFAGACVLYLLVCLVVLGLVVLVTLAVCGVSPTVDANQEKAEDDPSPPPA